MYGIIYRALNKTNQKSYIGQTIHSLEKRKRHHYSDYSACVYFHRALLKYPEECWEWTIIDEAENQQELDEKEKYWIKYYHSFGEGYNLTEGGQGSSGVIITSEHKLKTRNSMLQTKINHYHPYAGKNSKMVRCIETGQVFVSMSATAREMSLSYEKLKTAIKNGKAINGYHFELVKDAERINYLPEAFYCVELDKFYETYRQARVEDRFHEGNLRIALRTGDPYEPKIYAGYTFYWVNPQLYSGTHLSHLSQTSTQKF